MPDAPLPYKIAVLCDLRDAQGRVLLIHRAKHPNKDMYSPIGGKLDVETGESPAQCASREIREEAGVDVPVDRLRLVGVISERAYQNETHWLMFLYRVVGAVEVEEREINEGRLEWRTVEDFDRLPMPETDRRALWPLIHDQDGRFFALHIDCSEDPMKWVVEQAD